MLFVAERRRSRWRPSAIRGERCSRRRSAGEVAETHRDQRRFFKAAVSSDSTKTAASRRISQASGASH
jgi:hypothetical protein